MVSDLIHPDITVHGGVQHIEVFQGEHFDLRLRRTRGPIIWTEQNDPVLDHIEDPSGLVSHIKAAQPGISFLRVSDAISRLLITITVKKRPNPVEEEAATLNLTADPPVDQ